MAVIEGQIETLKSIKSVLRENGISRFKSIADINNFAKSFQGEKRALWIEEEKIVEDEIGTLEEKLNRSKKNLAALAEQEKEKLESFISNLKVKIEILDEKISRSTFSKIFYFLPHLRSKFKLERLQRNKSGVLKKRLARSESQTEIIAAELESKKAHKEKTISERVAPKERELERIMCVVDGLNTLIAGAIGEDKVVKELKKLPDKFTVFNDFSLAFNPPIYNKKENDRIYSVQIDHLLVTDSGIFIIETKNWSKKSVESLDLRSPVNQIMRTSYALFVVVNNEITKNKSFLRKHHWGDKQVPIRNLIAMIKEKPNESFQYVKVKTLKELCGYISHFEAIFDDMEVERITDLIRRLRDTHNLTT